jgi:hypothetical protein
MFTNEIIQEIVWLYNMRKQSKYALAKHFYTNVQKIQEILDEYGSPTEEEWENTTTYLLRRSKEGCKKV